MPLREEFVTGAEFGRFRADFQAFQNRLEERLDHGFGGMNTRLDALNGRTRGAEQNIAVIGRRLEAIESEDRAIEATVGQIQLHGCAQLAQHEAAVETLGWSKQKKAAAAGGLVGLGALMWPAIQQLIDIIHTLVDRTP